MKHAAHRLQVHVLSPASGLAGLRGLLDLAGEPDTAQTEQFFYVIERRRGERWRIVESRDFPSLGEARHAGHARWHELGLGPLYREAEPLGPTDAGDAYGDAQIGRAWVRRFWRKTTDGEHVAVIDVECGVINANPNSDEPPEVMLTRTLGYTLCTELANVGGTEVWSDPVSIDYEPKPGSRLPTDDDAYRMCAAYDISEETWDGEADLVAERRNQGPDTVLWEPQTAED